MRNRYREGCRMRDEKPVGSVLLLIVPGVLLLTAAWLLWGQTLRDAIYAAMKLVVIR